MQGESWRFWNEGVDENGKKIHNGIRDTLISQQDKGATAKHPHQMGSWPGSQGGRIMATSLSLLCLEVYYRHLPLYRRDPMVMGQRGDSSYGKTPLRSLFHGETPEIVSFPQFQLDAYDSPIRQSKPGRCGATAYGSACRSHTGAKSPISMAAGRSTRRTTETLRCRPATLPRACWNSKRSSPVALPRTTRAITPDSAPGPQTHAMS